MSMSRSIAAVIVLYTLNGVTPAAFAGTPAVVAPPPQPLFDLDPSLAARSPRSIVEPFETAGLQHLRAGQFELAGEEFRRALAVQPQNVAANFLNAFAYHQLGSMGDPQQYDAAAVGYELALQSDPHAWWAAYYYGAMELERRNYSKAQELMAQAVLVKPDESQPLLGLAISSYYLGDVEMAAATISRARAVSPDETPLLRASALISAAVGAAEDASKFVEGYETSAHPSQVKRLQTRLNEWERFYARVPSAADRVGPTGVSPQLASAMVAPATYVADEAAATASSAKLASEVAPETDMAEMEGTPTDEVEGPRQVVIEAAVIRSTRTALRRRGINLFDGLNLQFSYDNTRMSERLTGSEREVTRNITRSIGIPELNYSLNIFHTATDRNEIIARPSLLATEGETSSFFSGDLFIASLEGTLEASALTERVGVSVEVTPTFLSDEEFQLNITLGDSDFATGAIPGTFDQAVSVSTAETTVSVRVHLGQTVMLAGLTERQERQRADKVPVLGDIPVVQNLFRRKEVEQKVAETMILLTPRRVIDMAKLEDVLGEESPYFGGTEARSKEIEELRRTYLETFAPTTNFQHLMFHISESDFFRQFRRGDLNLEIWHGLETEKRLWDEILAYIYF
ncbi:hypothetical protein [Pacificimonas flava]|nr:hypothetical protein [Pacificimonas flava]